MSAAEFLRRYLQHFPPSGQHRVRYFGWPHPPARFLKVQALLVMPIIVDGAGAARTAVASALSALRGLGRVTKWN